MSERGSAKLKIALILIALAFLAYGYYGYIYIPSQQPYGTGGASCPPMLEPQGTFGAGGPCLYSLHSLAIGGILLVASIAFIFHKR